MSRPFTPRNFNNAPKHRLNGKIRAREVRVIGNDNQQLGVFSLSEAFRMAQAQGVDLVEIASEATPPVCRLVDYGKFRYEESKKQKKTSDRVRNQLKEIQLHPNIAANDYNTKINHAREFLAEGLQVKVAMRLRGREMRHPEIGLQLMQKFVADLAVIGRSDTPPRLIDRNINLLLRPLSRQQREKVVETTGAPAQKAAPATPPEPAAPAAPSPTP